MNRSPPTVCHVTTVHRVPDPRIFLKECRSLSRQGFNVHALYTGSDEGFAWGEIKPTRLGPRSRSRLKRLLYWPRIIRELCRIQPQVVHFHDPELLPLMYVLQVLSGKRRNFIYDIHEDYAQALQSYRWPFPALAVLYQAMLRLSEKQMSMVVAEDSYQTFLQRPRPVIHNFIDAPQSESGSPKRNTFIYVGTLSELRGASLMIESFSRVSRSDWTLEMMGIPDSPELLKKLKADALAKSRFPGQIEVCDFVPFSEASERIRRSKVGLCLLAPEPNSVHSLPTKVFDYLCFGVPVLLSNFPYYLEFFKGVPGVYFVDPLSLEDVTREMSRLCSIADSPELERQAQLGQRACLNRFTWKAEAEKLVGLYLKLLDDPAGRSSSSPVPSVEL